VRASAPASICARPYYGHFVAVVFAQDLDRVRYALGIGVRAEIGRHFDIVGRFPDRLAHLDRRPVVLLFPLDFAAERRRFLDNGKDRHNGVEAQLRIAGGGQARHQFGLAVGVGEGRIDQVHEFDGGDGCRVAQRRAIDGLAL
jgi:hypothetical protein